jgi:transcription elongation factor Elf1
MTREGIVACFVCGKSATVKVTVEKTDPKENLTYDCCDEHEPRHIPQGDVVFIRTVPLGEAN